MADRRGSHSSEEELELGDLLGDEREGRESPPSPDAGGRPTGSRASSTSILDMDGDDLEDLVKRTPRPTGATSTLTEEAEGKLSPEELKEKIKTIFEKLTPAGKTKEEEKRYVGTPRYEGTESLNQRIRDRVFQTGRKLEDPAIDLETPYPSIPLAKVDIRFQDLDDETQQDILRCEETAQELTDMAWSHGEALYRKIPLHELDRFAVLTGIYGVDRALDSLETRDHLWNCTPKKLKEESTGVYKGEYDIETIKLGLLREYYEVYVERNIQALFDLEQGSGFRNNLVGILMTRLLKARIQKTEQFRRVAAKKQNQEEFRENYLKPLLKEEARKTTPVPPTKKTTRLSFQVAAEQDQSKTRYRTAQPPAKPAFNEPREDRERTGRAILKNRPDTSRDTSRDDSPPPRPRRRATFYPDEGSEDERRERKRRDQDYRTPRALDPVPLVPTPYQRRPRDSKCAQPSRTKQEDQFQQQWEDLEDQLFLNDITSTEDEDEDDSDADSYRSHHRSQQGRRDRTRSRSQESYASSSSFFPGVGKVSKDTIYYREKPKKDQNQNRRLLKDMAESMKNAGQKPGYFTESNLVNAATFLKFQDSVQKARKNKDHENAPKIKKIDPHNQDLSIGSFDYDIRGLSEKDILGPRFTKTIFPSDSARIATMQGIFQYLVGRPDCVNPTKRIILDILEKFDVPKQQSMQTAHTIGAMSQTTIPNEDHIPPPVCGRKNKFHSNMQKAIFTQLGLVESTDKYCLEDPKSRSLSLFLPLVKTTIENYELTESSAFSLLLSILKGVVWDEVQTASSKGVKSFSEVWMSIQRTSGGPLHTAGLEKELRAIMTNPPPIQIALSQIQSLRIKMFAHVPARNNREAKTAEAIYNDFVEFMRTHYTMIAVIIESTFKQKELSHYMETTALKQQGVPESQIKPFDKAQEYRELVCSHVASDIENTAYPQFMVSTPSKKVVIHSLKPGTGILKAKEEPEEPSGDEEEIEKDSSCTASEYIAKEKHPWKKTGELRNKELRNNERESRPRPRNGFMKNESQDDSRSESRRRNTSGNFRDNNRDNRDRDYRGNGNGNGNGNGGREGYGGYRNNRERSNTRVILHPLALRVGMGVCFLCRKADHYSRDCTLYPGGQSVNNECPTCTGFHADPCRAHERDKVPQPIFQWMEDGLPGPPPRRYNNYNNNNNTRGPSYGQQPRNPNFYGGSANGPRQRLRESMQENGRENRQRNDETRQDARGPTGGRNDYANGGRTQHPRAQDDRTNQRDQRPVENGIGNAGAQVAPTSAHISAMKPSSRTRKRSDDDYDSERHGHSGSGYSTSRD